MKMNQVACWIVSAVLLGYSASSALAQERTKDPLAEPSRNSVPGPDQNSGVQEQTKSPLSDAETKPGPAKPTDTQTKNPLSDSGTTPGPEKSSDERTKNPLSGEAQKTPEKHEQLELSLPKNLVKDQIAIWTSPAYVRAADSLWLVPFLGVTAGFIATDRAAVSDLPSAPSTVNRFKNISDYGLYGTAAFSGAMYLSGALWNNPHQRETGWLAGEAVLDGLAVNTVIQQISRRQRPFSATNPGQWFQSSGDSFPSNHAMATFAAAAVITREYPGLLTDLLAYGMAGTVASMRVLGEQHSPSDVVVGSMIGYLIGRHVYAAHHNPELPGDSIGTVVKTKDSESGGSKFVASPYVPIDSYVYSLLDSLIAAGAVNSGILGQRPWTRAECARLVEEAGERVKAGSGESQIVDVLRREFAGNLEASGTQPSKMISIDEFYTRSQVISGTPLNDGFHFGQTLYDDYGRPYWKGFNNITGIIGSAVTGRFIMYGRGEYQHAPAVPAYSANAQPGFSQSVPAWEATADSVPFVPHGNSGTDVFRLIEGYAGVQFSKVSLTIGKQSLWWGPTVSGPFLFSNNAEPIYMARISQTAPIRLPWIFGYLGAFKVDSFFGKLSGDLYPDGPYVHGEKISFKPTPDLELGFSRTIIIGGKADGLCPSSYLPNGCPGHPLTFGYFLNGFTSVGDNPTTTPGSAGDVGDRRGGFDFTYRVPGLRNWLTLYGDFFTDDDPSPLAAPQRSAIMPGIYLAKFPFLHKLDFRAEAPMTAQAAISQYGGQFFYYNGAYRDGYTNKGFLLGDWIGRQAKGLFLSSRYLISPKANVQFSYRNQVTDPEFIRGGGTLDDFRVTAEFPLGQLFSFSSFVQFERWNIPLLASAPQHNITGSVELKYRPSRRWHGN
jgi:membrane-associated phospholipid phosphatase